MERNDDSLVRGGLAAIGRTVRSQLLILGGFVVVIWFLELLDILILRGSLDALGVRPRTIVGLRGILFMPLLHDGLGHVLANTAPFLILGWLVMVRRTEEFFFVSAVVMASSGLGAWLLGGSDSVHLGASGLIFGYFGFLLLRGYFERSLASILLAVFVGLSYGGLLFGLLPLQFGISWQAHLFGFLGGVLAARLVSRNRV